MLRCTASFVTAAYVEVGFIPQALCALPLWRILQSRPRIGNLRLFTKASYLVLMNSSNPKILD